jgi:hypothetical protein
MECASCRESHAAAPQESDLGATDANAVITAVTATATASTTATINFIYHHMVLLPTKRATTAHAEQGMHSL